METEKSEEDVQTGKKRRKIPSWVWSAIITELIHDAIPALLGIVTTLLVLIKAGILQLAHWPVAAFIVLIIVEVILIVAMFAFGLIYSWLLILHGFSSLISRWGHTEKPKWSRWLLPFDYLAIATMYALGKVIDWSVARKESKEDKIIRESVRREGDSDGGQDRA
jgi:membrane-bound ClpP family serine protease